MWQIDTKVNNYGSAWVDMYLLEPTDPVEGDSDPGGVPINIGDLEPSNETLYRLANNLKVIENNIEFATVTINVTTATIGTLQTLLDALGTMFPYGANLLVAFAAGTYTWPTGGITFNGFTGANTIFVYDGSTFHSGTYTASTRIFQQAATAPMFTFEDVNTAQIRINGLTMQTTGTWPTLFFDNCNTKVLVDSNYIDHQNATANACHLHAVDSPNVIFEDCATDLGNYSLKSDNSHIYVDNSGTVGGGTDPVNRSELLNGGRITFESTHNYDNTLNDVFTNIGSIRENVVRAKLTTPNSADGNFTLNGDITSSAGGAGKVLDWTSDYIWIYKYTGTFGAGNGIDNANPYAAPVDTISGANAINIERYNS